MEQKINIEKLCTLSGLDPNLENLEKLTSALVHNLKIVSVLNAVKIQNTQDASITDIDGNDLEDNDNPKTFEDVEALRKEFPDREGNELKIKKVL
jgi:Asp-tRNA(Asn)/Glu-tRNA(Gln) amidotransferase C subunit